MQLKIITLKLKNSSNNYYRGYRKSRALNIYDFAGNMIEWTLEKYKDEMVTTGRGGSYSDLEDYGKASSRINSSIKEGLENSRINFGFRIAMY